MSKDHAILQKKLFFCVSCFQLDPVEMQRTQSQLLLIIKLNTHEIVKASLLLTYCSDNTGLSQKTCDSSAFLNDVKGQCCIKNQCS